MQEPYSATERWSRLSEAATYALAIHAHQARKGTDIPYISHLLSVAGLEWNTVVMKSKPLPACCTTQLRTVGPRRR